MDREVRQSDPRVVTALFDLAAWFLERTNRFPKNWRVTLGDRMDTVVLEMVMLAERARSRSNKKEQLLQLSEHLDLLRILTRLAVRLECLQGRQYEYVSERLDGIGKQIGGWIRYIKAK